MLNTRNALLLGFGGLLALLVFSGIDAVQVLSQMSSGNGAIRREFLERARRVDEIRSAVYLSGTLVRDYLLEPDPRDAQSQLAGLNDVRQRMNSELRDYANLLPPNETDVINSLQTEIDVYWRMLEPVFHWSPEQRREQGYNFLRNEVFPRRTAMLRLADTIGGINARELTEGDRRLSEMFCAIPEPADCGACHHGRTRGASGRRQHGAYSPARAADRTPHRCGHEGSSRAS